jgi:hypothetical protein
MRSNEPKQLTVLHRLKDAAGHGHAEASVLQLSSQGLFVDTCLRQVSIIADAHAIPVADANTAILHGSDAYSFLLQTLTGLNSSIPGETNVLGQFRCAWKRWLKAAPAEQIAQLTKVMQKLFSDSKRVRRDHLENTGGASYGSLVRKILQPEANAKILFVGSGKFSQSMLPLFTAWQTGLWNHRLHKGLRVDHGALKFSPTSHAEAADWASHLVLTTPADETNDNLWSELASEHQLAHVIHLGRRRAEPGIWQNRSATMRFNDLDDVFDLRTKQTTLRDLSVLRARRACERLADDSATDRSLPETALAKSARA